jgi:mannose-6-phosphate isomerase-like protein (cupin superfamily)
MIQRDPFKALLITALLLLTTTACSSSSSSSSSSPKPATTSKPMTTPLILRRAEVMSRKPDTDKPNVRVWTMRKSDKSRTNLVEMKGKLSYHVHPDAEHTLMVLEGRVCAWHGTEAVLLETGDYISIPAGVPHKYETVGDRALLLSFDAPAYDPNLTQSVSEEGVTFAPCPSTAPPK